ncbi:hypothetical protein C5L32_000907 [Lentilactobacillus buchneri]|uniref:Uncharacterized protein n=1 Tax=Lentilactobacillus buchneri DSM 20057 TaxID=1423728 RepID=A0A4R5NNA7_LENBU|nr:hypothetical protein C5L32_000907 [Lentilactobacillus buchneri]
MVLKKGRNVIFANYVATFLIFIQDSIMRAYDP